MSVEIRALAERIEESYRKVCVPHWGDEPVMWTDEVGKTGRHKIYHHGFSGDDLIAYDLDEETARFIVLMQNSWPQVYRWLAGKKGGGDASRDSD